MDEMLLMGDADSTLRRVVIIVGALNLAYFGVEFTVARASGSVSLFADSIDFLEDAAVNFLIVVALAWSATARARVGMALAGILLVPGFATLWTAWEKFHVTIAPKPLLLTLAGTGALAGNVGCAFILARFREHRRSLAQAPFLSARNDALADFAVIVAGFLTVVSPSAWADQVVSLSIAFSMPTPRAMCGERHGSSITPPAPNTPVDTPNQLLER